MPFIAILDHDETAIIDYDCSIIDVELRIIFIDNYLVYNLVDIEYFNLFVKPTIYAVILILILFIKELRVKLSSKLLVIYSINEITQKFIVFLMIEYGIHRNLGPYDLTKLPINFVEVFKFVWLSIIAYDYLVVIR